MLFAAKTGHVVEGGGAAAPGTTPTPTGARAANTKPGTGRIRHALPHLRKRYPATSVYAQCVPAFSRTSCGAGFLRNASHNLFVDASAGGGGGGGTMTITITGATLVARVDAVVHVTYVCDQLFDPFTGFPVPASETSGNIFVSMQERVGSSVANGNGGASTMPACDRRCLFPAQAGGRSTGRHYATCHLRSNGYPGPAAAAPHPARHPPCALRAVVTRLHDFRRQPQPRHVWVIRPV